MKQLILFGLLTTAVCSCRDTVSGTYTDQLGMTKYKFENEGKVLISSINGEIESPYEIDGDQIKIKLGNGSSSILNIKDDNTLISGMQTFTKENN